MRSLRRTPPGPGFAAAVESVRSGDRTVEEAAAALRSTLTRHELLWLLDGDLQMVTGMIEFATGYGNHVYVGGRVDRVGIPGIRFTDGPRGVVTGSSTSFPVALARAATFDPELERTVGDAIGAEARVQGANLFAGICVNLAYAPGWGRSQESYGEDPLLLGAMGAALTEGVNPWLMSCVKHFAVNSMEESRFRVDVTVAEDVLREVYLPHFREVVEAGVDSVMSAYNAVNGEWAGQNRHLLTEVLREDWGFTGFVMTDFVWGLRDAVRSVEAGQDLEMPFRQQRAAELPRALAEHRLALADVEASADRLIGAQIRLELRARPTPPRAVVASPAHRELARETARRSAVLLRNAQVDGTPLLPLAADSLGRVAVLGSLADAANLGDVGSSYVRPPTTVSVLHGLRERLGDRVVVLSAEQASRAGEADVAVVVVGLSSVDEGESFLGMDTASVQLFGGLARLPLVAAVVGRLFGRVTRAKGWGGDRHDLRLHPRDVELVRAVARVNPRTVVVVIGGGTIVLDPWDTEVAAVLLAWYPGMEGGHAVADVLLGDAEPGGRLPLAIPHRQGDLPTLDWTTDRATYGRWWGQRKLDRDGIAAAYPFGFGLGYTTFAVDDLRVGPVVDEHFGATVRVANTGARTGRHVVQLYARVPERDDRTVSVLVGFASVELAAGAARDVEVVGSTRPLQRWTGSGFTVDATSVALEASAYAGAPGSARAVLTL